MKLNMPLEPDLVLFVLPVLVSSEETPDSPPDHSTEERGFNAKAKVRP
jgi:hypothetical protein